MNIDSLPASVLSIRAELDKIESILLKQNGADSESDKILRMTFAEFVQEVRAKHRDLVRHLPFFNSGPHQEVPDWLARFHPEFADYKTFAFVPMRVMVKLIDCDFGKVRLVSKKTIITFRKILSMYGIGH